jgi:SOS response regulatory protein OraA/RecX
MAAGQAQEGRKAGGAEGWERKEKKERFLIPKGFGMTNSAEV